MLAQFFRSQRCGARSLQRQRGAHCGGLGGARHWRAGFGDPPKPRSERGFGFNAHNSQTRALPCIRRVAGRSTPVACSTRNRLHHQRLPRAPAHPHVHDDAPARLDLPGERLPQPLVQLGIIGLPHAVAGLQPREINVPVLEKIAPALDPENPPALLRVGIAAGVENHAVAELQRDLRRQLHAVATHAHDPPGQRPALFSEPRGDQLLVVHAVHPAGIQPARKRHLELLPIRRVRHVRERGVDGLPIHLTHRRHVLRRLQPALDFETHHTQFQQRRNFLHRRQILRRKQIAPVAQIAHRAIHDQLVRHPARLRTLAAIRAPLPERFARQTLPGIRHAQRPMHEHLQRQRRFPIAELRQLPQRQLPRQHRALDAQLPRKRHALRRRDRHLRARVNRQLRRDRPCQPHQPDILHDERIHARAAQQPQILRRRVEFPGKNQRVESDVRFHPVPMTKSHDLRQLRLGEIVRPQPRVEFRQPEINCVRAIRHRRAHAVPAARGGEEFGCGKWGGRGHRKGGSIQ